MFVNWDESTVLGMAPPFHLDPRPGGPPLVSPDGHWRWEGHRWVVLDPTVVRPLLEVVADGLLR